MSSPQSENTPMACSPSPSITPSSSNTLLTKLGFGIELELLVRPRHDLQETKFRACLDRNGWSDYVVSTPCPGEDTEQSSQNRTALRAAIAEALTDAGVIASLPELCKQSEYRRWTVCPERLPEPPMFWGIELVSPVLTTADDWRAEINTVFDVLTKYLDVQSSPQCGMHVHVSPGRGQRFSDDQLQAICKGLTVFERPTTAVLPGNRKNNSYCKPNIETDYGCDVEIRQAWDGIPTKSWAPLLQLLDKISNKTVTEILHGIDKNSAWNFVHLLNKKGKGTIEFRRPPGVESAKQAIHWAGFVLGLFAGGLATNWASEGQRLRSRYDHPSVDDLKSFISLGLGCLGPTCHDVLVEEWIVEDTSEPTLTEEDQRDLIHGELIAQWHAKNDHIREEWRAKGIDIWTVSCRQDEPPLQAPREDDLESDDSTSWASSESDDWHTTAENFDWDQGWHSNCEDPDEVRDGESRVEVVPTSGW